MGGEGVLHSFRGHASRRGGEGGAIVPGHLAALDHQTVVLFARHALDVSDGIAVADDEVGGVAFLHPALVAEPHQVGGAGGREKQRIAR